MNAYTERASIDRPIPVLLQCSDTAKAGVIAWVNAMRELRALNWLIVDQYTEQYDPQTLIISDLSHYQRSA
jgi:hypothetical protein